MFGFQRDSFQGNGMGTTIVSMHCEFEILRYQRGIFVMDDVHSLQQTPFYEHLALLPT
jgi:hypothetical protein